MARIRYIKPEFFEDVRLAEQPYMIRLLYIGIWCWMDRSGVIEEEPRLIKRNVFPYDDEVTSAQVAKALDALVRARHLHRLTHAGKRFLYCPTFVRHQKFHRDEKQKYSIPLEELEASCEHHAATMPAQFGDPANSAGNGELVTENGQRGTGNGERATGNGVSRRPDREDSEPEQKRRPRKAPRAPGGEAPSTAVFASFREAYSERYPGVTYPDSAQLRSMMCTLIRKIGAEDAPEVARFFVRHNRAQYVQASHDFGLCLRDAVSLRTEWLQGRTVTWSEAKQAEQMQATVNGWGDLIQEAREREARNGSA